MRLIDRVMVAPDHSFARDSAGAIHRLPAPGAWADTLRDCSLRYMIDRAASYQCGALLRSEPDLICPESSRLRLPAERVWIEWFEEKMATPQGVIDGGRFAVFVEGDRHGRSGDMSFFFEDGPTGVGLSPLRLRYDLDAARPSKDPEGVCRITHGDMPHVAKLLQHGTIAFDPQWTKALRSSSAADRRQFLVAQAQSIWIAMPIVFGFAAILNTNAVLEQRPSTLARLNESRRRSGKPPLMEHVEVGMRIGGFGPASAVTTGTAYRTTPRLHYVRGHSVTRGGKVFWRSPHFRGDAERPILSRTVTVRGPASMPDRSH